MRFTSAQDYQLYLHFNKELVNIFVDIQVVIYKVKVHETKKNIYGESSTKRWYQGVQIPCLVSRQLNTATKDIQTINIEQQAEFNFLREECKLRNIYPEIGDIIDYNSLYFEIDQTNEIQLVAGQSIYNHSIIASTHMTRASNLQLELPVT